MIIVDASVVIDLVIGAGSEAGDALAGRLMAREVVCAPHLVDAEVGQVLRRFSLRGDLSDDRAKLLVRELSEVPIRRYPHTGLLARAFEFRSNVTVYDGLYLALAEALERPLLTGDAALRDVPGCEAVVDVVTTSA